MKILITGGTGQLGMALQRRLKRHECIPISRRTGFDITNPAQVTRTIQDKKPDLVINAAAFTNVDGCTRDYSHAHKVNAMGPQYLAIASHAANIPFVHISSNEVFDGTFRGEYQEWMAVNPINPYGVSKTAGEFNVRSVNPQHYIIRTAWLFSEDGHNFVHAILRGARKHGALKVVTDEIGNPTYAADLAEAIEQLVETGAYGTYHFVNSGDCSRWEFANEILKCAGMTDIPNRPILSSEFNRASTPPPFCRLANTNGAQVGITLRPWQEALQACFQNLDG